MTCVASANKERIDTYNAWTEQPARFADLDTEKADNVLAWIRENCKTARRANRCQHSYTLKHLMDHDISVYVFNGAFKGAMLAAGFTPVCQKTDNWVFCIHRILPTRPSAQNNKPLRDENCMLGKTYFGQANTNGNRGYFTAVRLEKFGEDDGVRWYTFKRTNGARRASGKTYIMSDRYVYENMVREDDPYR